MSALLRQHPDDLDALVSRTAAARGLPAPYVEKDFWVTEVLRSAAVDRTVVLPDGSHGQVRFLSKGGTSLCRVLGIVDRFSEDVDLLAVFPDDATPNARQALTPEPSTKTDRTTIATRARATRRPRPSWSPGRSPSDPRLRFVHPQAARTRQDQEIRRLNHR